MTVNFSCMVLALGIVCDTDKQNGRVIKNVIGVKQVQQQTWKMAEKRIKREGHRYGGALPRNKHYLSILTTYLMENEHMLKVTPPSTPVEGTKGTHGLLLHHISIQ